ESRFEPNRLGAIGNGVVVLTQSDICECTLGVIVVFRVEPDRLGEVGNCILELALLVVALAPPEIGVRESRVEPNDLAEVGNGSLECSLFAKGHAAFAIISGGLRAETEQVREESHG